jgi:murein L,D-transpeptidase YcbB/YkuD
MMRQGMNRYFSKFSRILTAGMVAGTLLVTTPGTSQAGQSDAFVLALAEATVNDPTLITFYAARNFAPIWTGFDDLERRRALFAALSRAGDHGLPTARYAADQLIRDFSSIRSVQARAYLELETTRRFLQYVQDIHGGAIDPRELSKDFGREPPRLEAYQVLTDFMEAADPDGFIRMLAPTHPDYARLMKEKARLEQVVANGGWGLPVKANKLKLGSKGDAVVALRARLTALGYRRVGISPIFDEQLETDVKLFQEDHGLNPDGVAGGTTIEALNVTAEERLQQVVVGLERLRWLNIERGKRHIFVNQADFRAFVMDDGKPTLETRVVVGKASSKYRTPEFSDVMTHIVINPTWHVPQSIAGGEYLPMLKKDPTSLGRQGLVMTDVRGRRVDPTTLDYETYSASNFPFDLKQPPGSRNALGKVKFLFPNHYNVYLHDTPSKSLFGRDIRAFSHGCVRVQKPFELAYTLLGAQEDDPEGTFHTILKTGRETEVWLDEPIPVHLVYHSVWVTPEGRVNYRLDTYGRDSLVFDALQKAGVVLDLVQG